MPPGREKSWLPFALVVLAAALAHLWCLGSQFYLDDINQIRDNPEIIAGRFLDKGALSWTNFSYIVQYRLFGMSPVGFHAVNWLLHASIACVLYVLARDLIKDRAVPGTALFAALLFAVHPLASEIPNYARTQDLAWVTLFSLLASWRMVRFLDGGDWKDLVFTILAVLGAAFSKGPGLFHALMMTGAVGIVCSRAEHFRLVRKHPLISFAVIIVGFVAVWYLGNLGNKLQIVNRFAEPRFISHALILGRVFWEFAWRGVVPISLSADHHIAETVVPPGTLYWNVEDGFSFLAALGVLATMLVSVLLAWRRPTRLFGLCLFLFVGTIFFRAFYVVQEYMPEYRIYPGMPWFCLGAALLLGCLLKFLAIPPRIPAVILLLAFTFLSAKRSFLWHDLDRLMADVLKQYPTQARAVWELHDRDLSIGDWQAVIDRQTQVWPEVARRFHAENQRLKPGRELTTGHFALAEVACAGRYARALAAKGDSVAGLREINKLGIYMQRLGLDPKAHAIHWSYFHHDKGLILEMAGNLEAAEKSLRSSLLPEAALYQMRKLDLERVEKKLKPGS